MPLKLDITKPPARPLVAPSILSADFGYMIRECRDVLDRGADLLHVDVMDGHFVPNLTMGVDMIRALRRHLPDVFLDVHLMVERPGDYVAMFADAGADLFTFHFELCAEAGGELDAAALAKQIRARGMRVGIAVNPPTAIEPMEPLLELVDLVLVMSVNPGRSGQAFMPEVLSKAAWLKQRIGEGVRLEMDGGLKPSTAPQAIAAGVDVVVAASAVFQVEDRGGAMRALRGA